MKFTREDTPTIMDGAVVRYRSGDFEINASRNGISANGFMPMIRQQEDLDTVCEYMRRAFRQYVALSPNRSSMRSYANPLPESVFEAVEHRAPADLPTECPHGHGDLVIDHDHVYCDTCKFSESRDVQD